MTFEHNPFAAPNTDATAAGGIVPFRSAAGFGTLAVCLIGIVLFLRTVSSVFYYRYVTGMEAFLNAEGTFSPSDMSDLISRTGLMVGAARLGAIFVTLFASVVVLFWIYRAHRNLPALGNYRIKYAPGWCVVYWLVPIVNSFRPYQAMCELMNGSDPKRYDTSLAHLPLQSANLLLAVWWASFLLMLIAIAFSFQASFAGIDLRDGLALDLTVTGSILVSGALTIAVIQRMSAFQGRRHELAVAAEQSDPLS